MTQNTAKNWKSEKAWLVKIANKLDKLRYDMDEDEGDWIYDELGTVVEQIRQRIEHLSRPTHNV